MKTHSAEAVQAVAHPKFAAFAEVYRRNLRTPFAEGDYAAEVRLWGEFQDEVGVEVAEGAFWILDGTLPADSRSDCTPNG